MDRRLGGSVLVSLVASLSNRHLPSYTHQWVGGTQTLAVPVSSAVSSSKTRPQSYRQPTMGVLTLRAQNSAAASFSGSINSPHHPPGWSLFMCMIHSITSSRCREVIIIRNEGGSNRQKDGVWGCFIFFFSFLFFCFLVFSFLFKCGIKKRHILGGRNLGFDSSQRGCYVGPGHMCGNIGVLQLGSSCWSHHGLPSHLEVGSRDLSDGFGVPERLSEALGGRKTLEGRRDPLRSSGTL